MEHDVIGRPMVTGAVWLVRMRQAMQDLLMLLCCGQGRGIQAALGCSQSSQSIAARRAVMRGLQTASIQLTGVLAVPFMQLAAHIERGVLTCTQVTWYAAQVISLGALDSLARRQRSKAPLDIFGGILQAVPEQAVPHVTSVLARLHADPSFQGPPPALPLVCLRADPCLVAASSAHAQVIPCPRLHCTLAAHLLSQPVFMG